MKYSAEATRLFFKEAAINLRREGFDVSDLKDGHLAVSLLEHPICKVTKPGGITYRGEYIAAHNLWAENDRAYDIVRSTAEYVRQFESAQPLKVKDLENYRVLADFNGTVLAATESQFGVQFVTWDWDFNHKGVSHGHYYGGEYKAAKEDFVVRSGLLSQYRLLSEIQLTEIYRCCKDTLNEDCDMSAHETKVIVGVCNQIEMEMPDIADRLTQEYDMQSPIM